MHYAKQCVYHMLYWRISVLSVGTTHCTGVIWFSYPVSIILKVFFFFVICIAFPFHTWYDKTLRLFNGILLPTNPVLDGSIYNKMCQTYYLDALYGSQAQLNTETYSAIRNHYKSSIQLSAMHASFPLCTTKINCLLQTINHLKLTITLRALPSHQ